jgi:hypothetical protein
MEDAYVNAILNRNFCLSYDKISEDGTCLKNKTPVINLGGVNLRNLSVSNLQKLQELKQINISNANLKQTILPIKMQNAVLSRSDLTGADLTGVDLTGADLSHSILINADLTGANLLDTKLWGTDLTGAILLGVQNMETAKMSETTTFDKAQKQQLVAIGVNISKLKVDHRIKSARPPVLKRTISTNFPDQLETNYCWAYSMSKVIHRFLKSILVELKTEEDNPSCDKFYSNHLFQSQQHTLNAELCGGDKEYKNVVLFMFIFNELTKMHGCDSGSRVFQTQIYTDKFIERYIKSDLQYSDITRTPVIDRHLRVVFELLKKISRIHTRDYFTIRYYGGDYSDSFSYDVLFTIIKNVIDQGLYLSLSMPLQNISIKFFEPLKNLVDVDTGHSLTVVGYNDDDKSIKFKNSWGDRMKYLTILLDELKHPSNDITIIWIAPPDELYFKSSKGSSVGAVRDRSYNSSKDSINLRYSNNYNESDSINFGVGLRKKKMTRVKKSKKNKKNNKSKKV